MKKTVLSAVALAVAFGAGISAAQAETRIGVTIYKYDDNFMSLMRKEIQKDADQLKDVKLLMNDSQNAQSIQNDQVDVLLSKGVKALAINLVDPSAAPSSGRNHSVAMSKDAPDFTDAVLEYSIPGLLYDIQLLRQH